MNTIHIPLAMQLVIVLMTARLHATETTSAIAITNNGIESPHVVTSKKPELRKVRLADLLGESDMIAVGRVVPQPLVAATGVSGKITYLMSVSDGRRIVLTNRGSFELVDFAVQEIVAATDNLNASGDLLALIGGGATGIQILTQCSTWEKDDYSDPIHGYGGGLMLLFLERYPLSESDAIHGQITNTNMVFRVVYGDGGCTRLYQTAVAFRVADAASSDDVLQTAREASEHLSASNTNSGNRVYSGSNTGLYWSTIQELDKKATPKKFKTTGKKIEQRLLDPIGKPMR